MRILENSRVKLIIAMDDPFSVEFNFFVADTVLIMDGSLFKVDTYRRGIYPTTTMAFFSDDSFKNPEASLPRCRMDETDGLVKWFFPLITLEENGSPSGVVAYAITEFVKYINKRLEKKLGSLYNLTIEESIPLHVETVTGNEYMIDYPLMQNDDCFLTPVLDEISTQSLITKPFTTSTWISILIINVYLTGFLRLFFFKDLFSSFFESLKITFGAVHQGIACSLIRNNFAYLILYLYGFIIYNLHISKLSSYLATPNFGKRIETLQDVIENNITLWSLYDLLPLYEKELNGFLNLSIEPEIFYVNLDGFNTEQGYLIPRFTWRYINHRQKLLKKKSFSFSNICVARGFLTPFQFVYGKTAVLQEIINYFTMRIIESGLDYIWEQNTFQDIGVTYMKTHSLATVILGFKYFQVPFCIYSLGIGLSLISFCIESSIIRKTTH